MPPHSLAGETSRTWELKKLLLLPRELQKDLSDPPGGDYQYLVFCAPDSALPTLNKYPDVRNGGVHVKEDVAKRHRAVRCFESFL